MKRRVVTAFLLLAALGARVEAGQLPKPISAIERNKIFNFTHVVRGAQQELPQPMRDDTRDRYRPSRQTHAVRGR